MGIKASITRTRFMYTEDFYQISILMDQAQNVIVRNIILEIIIFSSQNSFNRFIKYLLRYLLRTNVFFNVQTKDNIELAKLSSLVEFNPADTYFLPLTNITS